MARDERFNFICTKEEKRLIAAVAEKLNRTQSDTIRLLVKGAALELGVVGQDNGRELATAGSSHEQR